MDVDIHGIKAKLEAVGQVKSASVERELPDSLRIDLREHQPVMRLVLETETGKKQMRLVSRTGVVFEGGPERNGSAGTAIPGAVFPAGRKLRTVKGHRKGYAITRNLQNALSRGIQYLEGGALDALQRRGGLARGSY
jgi:cell division septal protein FtsQ